MPRFRLGDDTSKPSIDIAPLFDVLLNMTANSREGIFFGCV